MKYAILIYGNEAAWSTMPKEQAAQAFGAFMDFNKALLASGVVRAGEQLKPTATATSVRVREGKVANADGPFAETKEQLGGFYVIDVENLDAALAWAAKCPAALGGSVEVRPVLELDKAF